MAIRTFGSGDDVVRGTSANDTFRLGAGDDIADGGLGRDRLYGQDDNDTVRGGNGNDRVFGDSGFDAVRGGEGNDVVGGGRENDDVRGDLGADVVDGNIGNDRLALGVDFELREQATEDELEFLVGDGFVDTARFVVDTVTESGRDTLYDLSLSRTVGGGPEGDEVEVGDGDLIDLGQFGSFADLDSNGDEVLNNDDDFVGASSTRITLDVGSAFGVDDATTRADDQTLTIVGYNELFESDFLVA